MLCALASATLIVGGVLPVHFAFADTSPAFTTAPDLQRGRFVPVGSMCDGPDGVLALLGPMCGVQA